NLLPATLQLWLTRDWRPNGKQFSITGLAVLNRQRRYIKKLTSPFVLSNIILKNFEIQKPLNTEKEMDALLRLHKACLAQLDSMCTETLLFQHGNLCPRCKQHKIFPFRIVLFGGI